MAMFAVCPWLKLDSAIEIGDFRWSPWRRGNRTPAHWTETEQGVLDSLLLPFHTVHGRSIHFATVVSHKGALFDDLDETAREELFWLNRLVAFAGLAARDFFGHNYSNTDCYRILIQAFDEADPAGGSSRRHRRRDGSVNAYSTRATNIDIRPGHVSPPIAQGHPLDRRLLAALVNARASGDNQSTRLMRALPLFLDANTDRGGASERSEMVLTVSAFERMLDCKPKDRDIVQAFQDAMHFPRPQDRTNSARTTARRYSYAGTIGAVWMADLFASRGSLAHGHSAHPFLWSTHEHLLLGAFCFPLLAKRLLHEAGHYQLTSRDRASICAFEDLAGHRCLFAEEPPWPWVEILAESAFVALLASP